MTTSAFPGAAAAGPRPAVEAAPRFPVLDTLRAVGALAVLTTHTSFQAGSYGRSGLWGVLTARLDVGVALFFVLSGFLLARPWLARAVQDAARPSIGRYYWKRFLRIYPLYAVTVLIALLAIGENQGRTALAWLRTLTLTDVYFVNMLPHGLTQMWSLAAEVAFYVVLPGLMLLAVGRSGPLRGSRVLALLAAMVALGWWWQVDGAVRIAGGSPGIPLTWLPAYSTWFAVGIGLALIHVLLPLGRLPRRLAAAVTTLGALPGVCWTAVAGLLLVCATPVAGPTLLQVATTGESLAKNLLYAAIGGLVVLTGAFADPAGRYARAMGSRPLRHLGVISYGIFSLHLSVLALVWTVTGHPLFRGHGVQVWLLTVAGTLVAAEVLYRVVERPAMRLRDVGRGTGPAPADPTRPAALD